MMPTSAMQIPIAPQTPLDRLRLSCHTEIWQKVRKCIQKVNHKIISPPPARKDKSRIASSLLKTDFSFSMFFFLSENYLFENRGVVVRTCTQLDGLCFLGCRPGWTWIAFCHNILSCCKKMKKFIPPQANAVWPSPHESIRICELGVMVCTWNSSI
jgi:hypothetical protein